MSWLACRSMRGPVRRLVHQTESYICSASRMVVRVHVDGVGYGCGDGCRDAVDGCVSVRMDGLANGRMPTFREAIDVADVARSRRSRRVRFVVARCVSMLLVVGAVAVASLPFVMQARSAWRLAEISDSAARAVAGWP